MLCCGRPHDGPTTHFTSEMHQSVSGSLEKSRTKVFLGNGGTTLGNKLLLCSSFNFIYAGLQTSFLYSVSVIFGADYRARFFHDITFTAVMLAQHSICIYANMFLIIVQWYTWIDVCMYFFDNSVTVLHSNFQLDRVFYILQALLYMCRISSRVIVNIS